MNKILLLIACLVLNAVISTAQNNRVEYYDVNGKIVPQDQARFERTIIQSIDGSTTTIEKNISTGHVDTTVTEEPFGIVKVRRVTLDYDFKIQYANDKCNNGDLLPELTNYFEDIDNLTYVAAKLPNNENINHFLSTNIRYPGYAKEYGLQGRVTAQFVISKDGSVSNISIIKGVNVVLDKEFVRVLRKLKFAAPPKINGQPVELCVTMPCAFRLQ